MPTDNTIPNGFVKGEVIDCQQWTDNEFSLSIKASIEPYQAGQFTKLALHDKDGNFLRRAYSFINSPNHSLGPDIMEFLIIEVASGNLSPNLARLSVGDAVYVGNKASGFMTLNEIPTTAKDLWLLSTGTAIGPFLSLLAEPECKQRFDNLVLVHAVRTKQELVYRQLIIDLVKCYGGKLTFIPIVSREKHPEIFSGRIPNLLLDGKLQTTAKITPNKQSSFFYLCGNPAMIHDTQDVLLKLGFEKHLRRSPGHFSFENYW